ncbi:2Fe-2S iron-sulfur cluster-binding protein [Rhodovulum viride]|uniref:2Fe-2S iron-sulfur cluster-binding protein n=1 Tax=Rhodovulum viride TaxID=1231134 RepID=UPI001C65F789
MTGQLVRLAEKGRPPVRFMLDGRACQALAGDTVLTAVLTSARSLRAGDAGPERRAGSA